MRTELFLETFNPYRSFKDEWVNGAFYNSITPMEITNIVYQEEGKCMKFKKCLNCTHADNPWRCACCCNADMFAPIEKTVTTEKEYNKMYKKPIDPIGYRIPAIKNVIFSGRATIIFWEDNTKTVVKCDKDDVYDPHTGLAEAIAKKALGDYYRRLFRKYIKQYNKQKEKEAKLLAQLATDIVNTLNKKDDAE